MSLKDYLNDFTTLGSRTAPDISLSQLKKEALKLRERHGFTTVPIPNATDIQAVYRKLLKSFQHQSLSLDLSRKKMNLVPWAFMLPVDGNPPLYENETYITILFTHLGESSKPEAVRPFIQAFLQEYPLHSEQFEPLRSGLYELVATNKHTKLNTIKEWILNSRILDRHSHQECSEQLLSKGFQSTFTQYKLSMGLEYGRFAIESLLFYLKRLEVDLSTYSDEIQVELISECLDFFIEKDDSFKYPLLRVQLAQGLLTSYSRHQASSRIKKLLTDFFLQQYGDPRTSTEQWHGVHSLALDVIKGWMVENTMNDFFNLLSHVAKTDSTADKHWRYRKRFWNAYLKKGHIQEAWVALGTRAYAEANSFLQGGRNTYATLSGAQPHHSALIMVINGVMITEWSHVGSYRLWDNSNKRPKLYLKSYHRESLVNWADYTGPHTGSENGRWQYKLSQLINDLTGVSVSNKEYMHV